MRISDWSSDVCSSDLQKRAQMSENREAFTRLIQEHREKRQPKAWQGTCLEYLERVKKDPSLAKLAHARLYDVVIQEGVEDLAQREDRRIKRIFGDEPVKAYNFFKNDFYGIEPQIAQIVSYLHSAALKGEESRPEIGRASGREKGCQYG